MSDMNKSNKSMSKAAFAVPAIILVLLIAFAIVAGNWMFCRIYVPAGYMAVVTAKSGKTPAPGTILVERGEKGIWREVLSEGRHFLNPVKYDVRIVQATVIPLGQVGIVTSKVGKELPPGEIIAPDHESKGIWRDALGPGVYRLNPEGYSIELMDAINIPAGYVGVITSQTGRVPAPGEFAGPGEKGVLRDILQPGLYYINRYAYQVNVIEIGMNQVTMTASSDASVFSTKSRMANQNTALAELEANTLNVQQVQRMNQQMDSISNVSSSFAPRKSKKMPDMKPVADAALDVKADKAYEPTQLYGVSKAVEFPSKDGFKVSLEMTVEFELMPEHIAKIYLLYGDLPQVVEKIILPQVLSVSRLKGSSYGAQDFIMGEGRENFQQDLRKELEKTLATKNIIVHNAIIRTVDIPMDILKLMRDVSLAKEQDKTNEAMKETAKKLAELNIETGKIEQGRREVQQETEKLVAMIAAESRREVEAINAECKRKVAEIGVQRSELEAKTAKLKGETEIKAKFLVDNEKALGEGLQAKVLGGEGALCRLRAVEALNSKTELKVIYAGQGTLWTDLEKAAVTVPDQAE